MTEITEQSANFPTRSSASSCIGATWADSGGVNRSVTQIHALLYLSERPLHRRGDRRGARARALQRLELDQGADGLEPDPAGADPGRPARALRGRNRPLGNRDADRRRSARSARSIRRWRRSRACVADAERDPELHPVARKRLAGDAGLRRDAGSLVRADARRAEAEARDADPPRRPHRQPAAARPQK